MLNTLTPLGSQFYQGVHDSLNLIYAFKMLFESQKLKNIIKGTALPNLIFVLIYLFLGIHWLFETLLYVPLVMIQFMTNYYLLLKMHLALGNLFTDNRKEIDLVEKITELVSDAIFCNITIILGQIVALVLHSIGVIDILSYSIPFLVYSTIIGYNTCINILIEQGYVYDNRINFIESHLVYLIGYGLPLTIGYYTLPLVIYFALQSIMIPLMIVNTRQNFHPQPLVGGALPIIHSINYFNKYLLELILELGRAAWSLLRPIEK